MNYKEWKQQTAKQADPAQCPAVDFKQLYEIGLTPQAAAVIAHAVQQQTQKESPLSATRQNENR